MNKSMIRYNIHIPPGWIGQMAILQESLKEGNLPSLRFKHLTIADLMRTAISRIFRLGDPKTHIPDCLMEEEITKALKILVKEGKWLNK